MRQWQAIVFDLDDTLYPEREYVLSGFRTVADWAFANLGVPADEGYQQLLSLYLAGVRGDTFDRWLLEFGFPSSLSALLVQVYRGHQPCIEPFPEVLGVLSELSRHYRLGLLSDGYLSVQQAKLDALGIRDHFDAILFTDELGRENWKPSTKPFREILLRLAIETPGEAMYVADNAKKDFIGAKQIGIYTVWIRRPQGEYTHIDAPTTQHEPDVTMWSLMQLSNFLIKPYSKA